ncbi:Uncharacterized protein SCF082_LOCUS11010, partial [Durusdinium trenchii]
MFIRKLLLVGLCICEPIVRLTDSWSIGLLGTSPKGEDTCKAEQGCEAGSPPGGVQGGRGAFSRPAGPGEGAKPGKQPWWIPFDFSWVVGISWRLIQDVAHTSLEYCGTLCASIGLAARWSYWLVTAAVIVFLVQLSVWTFKWVVFPLCKYCLAVWRASRVYAAAEDAGAARSAPGGRPVDGTAAKEREEPMAGGPNSTRTNDERQKAALLGKYLTLILEGKNEREALSSCVEGDTGPHETWEILKEQGSGYVAKLPRDYPGVAKRAIIHLVTEECPHLTPPAIAEEDPVLGLKLPPGPSPEPFPQATNTTMPTPKGPSHGQAPGAETRAATPLTACLYLPRRGTSSAFPPRAQDVLAAVARPRHIGASEEEVSEHLAGAPRTWHIGAYTDAEPQALDETAKALQAIAKAVTSKDEAASQEKGKIASIGKTEERLVYIFRGFDALTVPVGSATVGKELFHALKATATQGRPQLRAIQFPVNINNRIAYGLSSMSIGGKDLRALPEHSISAADFPLTSQEEFDAFAGTPDFKLEKRVKGAATLNHWYRNALRQAWAISCVYGTEHYSTFEAAACYLLKLGEEHSYAWPAHVILGVWEELWARLGEEIRDLDRNLRRAMLEESPTFERTRFFATAPGTDGEPWLRLPRTFFLEDQAEYFQTDVLPRHDGLLSRACWQVALKKAPTLNLQGGKAGGTEEPPEKDEVQEKMEALRKTQAAKQAEMVDE